MFRKVIKKKHFRRFSSQLRGARVLRNQNKTFFVPDNVSALTEKELGLSTIDFPKFLVGNHGHIAENLLRQIFIGNYNNICAAVYQYFGNGKPIRIALPPSWREHLVSNGIECSKFFCNVNLFFQSMNYFFRGIIKSIYLSFPFNTKKSPDCPYLVFTQLEQNNLPNLSNGKSFDIITWYKQSLIKDPRISKYWVQVKLKNKYKAPDDLITDRTVFPRLENPLMYINYFVRITISFFVSLFGLLMGKWWYGFLYHENILLNYLYCLKDEQLAIHYYFSNSSWYYEPLWAHEVEARGKSVSLFNYSVNMHKRRRNEYKYPDTYGTKNMLWNNFIVWDKEQVEFWIRYRPNASFIIVGYIYQTGIKFESKLDTNKNSIA